MALIHFMIVFAVAEATTLNLKYSDCGATHGKITGLTPDALPLGSKTTVTGAGTIDEAVAGGTFEMDLKASIISQTFTGDVCTPKTFNLPLNTGSITWDGLKCPLAAGSVNVPVDITLSASLPAPLRTVDLKVKSKSSNGDDLLCMDVKTSPSTVSEPVVVAVAEATTLNLKYSDCGATHGKISGLTPDTLALGSKTTVTGAGTIDEAVAGGTFEMDLKASIISQTFTGDVCTAKTFNLPLNTGSITWDGLKCPLAAGSVNVPVDIILSASLPAPLRTVDLKVKSKSSNGDDLLCMDVKTSPSTVSESIVV